MNNVRKSFQRLSVVSRSITTRAGKDVYDMLGISKPPKRPSTSFFRFIQEHRERDKSLPSAKGTIIVLRDKWAALSEEDKQKYFRSYREDLVKYKELSDKYKESLSEEEKEKIKRFMVEKAFVKELKSRKKALKAEIVSSQKPKQPVTAFSRFFRTRDGNKLLEAQIAWKALGEEGQKPYFEAYRTEKQQYVKELEEWEERMLKEGRFHLVRKSALVSRKNTQRDIGK